MGVWVTQRGTEPAAGLGLPCAGPPHPRSHCRALTEPLGPVPAKGSALVLHDDLGCGKRKRWREAGGWDRDDDTPQLHFYLETLEKVFLAGHAFHFTNEQDESFRYPLPL